MAEPSPTRKRQTRIKIVVAFTCAAIGILIGAASASAGAFDNEDGLASKSIEPVDEEAQRLADLANGAYKTGDYARAVAGYSSLIKLKPRDARVFFNRGLARYKLQEMQKAYDDFSEALGIEPRFPLALINRAKISLLRQYYRNALEDIDRAFALKPADPAILYHRGIAHQGLGEGAKALADFTKAIQYSPTFAPAFSERGHAFLAQGKDAEAVRDFNVALRLDPGNVRARMGLEQLTTVVLSRPPPTPWSLFENEKNNDIQQSNANDGVR
ncbi:tetratricopeptide repeat protein [Hyphomicrobium sp.]|uniref:tetratricopeptide repeat protein n=1 Tax=Hyphomicrobium sp. TaxID=82 RepID=UPI0035678BD0